jgi:large repetitive protein
MLRQLSVLALFAALFFVAAGCTTSGNPSTQTDGSSMEGPDAGDGGSSPPADSCEVITGDGDAIIYRGLVLAPEGPTLGEVATVGPWIECVGADCASEHPDATVVDCGGAVISPGLINPHDHMTFNENGPLALTDKRYDHRHEWRGELRAPQNPSGIGRHQPGSVWTELRHLFAGTTTVVGSGNASDLIRHLDDLRNRDREQGFFEVIYDTFPLGDSDARNDNELIAPDDCGWNYRRSSYEASRAAAYIPHVAEGIIDYANEEFRCLSTDFGNARDFTQPNASHIHSIGLTAVDLHRMARAGTRLIWSPRSNIALYGMTADVSTFHRFGGTIAISTDWAYSGSANMFRELACADSFNRTYLRGVFTDRDLWEMATINAAIATGNDHRIGSLEVGKVADLLIVDSRRGSYRAILEAESRDVLLVAVAGEVMYGARETLAALGDPCDAVDVCGEERAVCLSRKLNEVRPDRALSYDELVEQISSGAYPLFFCGRPSNEPTCHPSRPGEYTGLRDADDRSGDGIPTEEDLCPDVFHPIRPMDGGRQADFDGDGVGDPCDESPVPDDISGDGIPNDEDNCPYDFNPDQTDSSGDGKGDACDACPDIFNPDTACPPATPVSIRAIHTELDPDDEVFVMGAVVTGIYDQGFAMQDPNPENDDPRRSGILVFTFDRPNFLSIGDLVDVEGRKTVFGGNVEITGARVFRLRAGTPLEPTGVTVAQAATSAYQGVLIRLTNGEVSDASYDCSQDHGSCSDEGLWEVRDNGGAVLIYDRLYQGSDWNARIGELPVSGVMMRRFNRNRVMPRSAADFP